MSSDYLLNQAKSRQLVPVCGTTKAADVNWHLRWCVRVLYTPKHAHEWYIWGLLCLYWRASVEIWQEMRDTDAFKPGMLWFMVATSPATHTHLCTTKDLSAGSVTYISSSGALCLSRPTRTNSPQKQQFHHNRSADWHVLLTVPRPPELTRVLNEPVRALPHRGLTDERWEKLKHVQLSAIRHWDHRDLHAWEPSSERNVVSFMFRTKKGTNYVKLCF